jgi:hypothetical protein
MRSQLFLWIFGLVIAAGPSLYARPRPAAKDEKLKHRLHRLLTGQMRSFLQQNVSVPQARKLGDSLERSVDRLSRRDPDSEPLQLMYCELAVALSMAFKEDEDPKRAQELYGKAQVKASGLLKQRYPKHYLAFIKGPVEKTRAAMKLLKKSDVSAVFWYSFTLGLETNLIRSTELLVQLPRQRMLMEWVLARNETIFNAGPHLSLALTYSAFPKAAGGDLSKALKHFTAIERVTSRRWLFARVIRAKYFSVALQNDVPKNATIKERQQAGKLAWCDFFMQCESVSKAPDKLWPERNLYNSVAKVKAKTMLKNAEDYIFPPRGYINPYEDEE